MSEVLTHYENPESKANTQALASLRLLASQAGNLEARQIFGGAEKERREAFYKRIVKEASERVIYAAITKTKPQGVDKNNLPIENHDNFEYKSLGMVYKKPELNIDMISKIKAFLELNEGYKFLHPLNENSSNEAQVVASPIYNDMQVVFYDSRSNGSILDPGRSTINRWVIVYNVKNNSSPYFGLAMGKKLPVETKSPLICPESKVLFYARGILANLNPKVLPFVDYSLTGYNENRPEPINKTGRLPIINLEDRSASIISHPYGDNIETSISSLESLNNPQNAPNIASEFLPTSQNDEYVNRYFKYYLNQALQKNDERGYQLNSLI